MENSFLFKVHALFFVSFFLFSCQNDDDSSFIQNSKVKKEILNDIPNEGYIPVGKTEEVKLLNGMSAYIDEDSVCFLGDVIFPQEWIMPSNDDSSIFRSAVTKNVSLYWKNKNIPYYIQAQDGNYSFTEDDQMTIRSGLSLLSNATTINFIEQTTPPLSEHYIRFIPGNGNYSPIGKQSTAANEIHLHPSGFIAGTAAHEIMHTLGYFHEQCRTDRDYYVTINWNNIESGHEHNFNIYTNTYGAGYERGSFDFNSIMMYGSYSFSSNNLPTITKLDGSTFFANRFYLSSGDVEGLQFIYGPRPYIDNIVTYENAEFDLYSEMIYEYDNVLRFTDSAGNFVSLTYPRLVKITYYVTTQDSEWSQPTNHSSSETRIIPAGTSEVYLGKTKFVDRRDYGNIIEYYASYYFVDTP